MTRATDQRLLLEPSPYPGLGVSIARWIGPYRRLDEVRREVEKERGR